MKRIGITGGIGSGKSTVSGILRIMGYPVFDSDKEARYLMNNNPELKVSIQSIFGSESYNEHGLNRQHISRIVFSDPIKLEQLESLVHPAVEKHFYDWCEQQNSRLIFKEAAILFESGAYKGLDYIICVTAPKEERINRVMKRDKVTREQVLKRMDNQWPEGKKIELADFVVKADDEHFIIKQLLEILNKIKTQ